MSFPQSNTDSLKDLEEKKKEFADALSTLVSTWLDPVQLSKAVEQRPHYSLLLECFSFGFALREKVTQLQQEQR